MRKVIYSLLGIVVLGFGVGPFVTGYMMQSHMEKRLTELSSLYGLNNSSISSSLTSYKRGWFSSKAQIDVNVLDPTFQQTIKTLFKTTDDVAKNPVSIMVHVYHGPLVFFSDVSSFSKPLFALGEVYNSLQFKGGVADRFNEFFQQHANLITSQILVNFDGSSTTNIQSAPVHSQNDKRSFDWAGLQGSIRLTQQLDQIVTAATFHGLKYQSGNWKFSSEPISTKSDMSKGPAGLWFGTNTISIANINSESTGQNKFQLKNLDLVTDIKLVNQLMNFSQQIKLDKFILNQADVGPGEFKLNINNVDLNTIVSLNDQAVQMNKQAASAQNSAEDQAKIKGLLIQLLQKGMVVQLEKFNLTTLAGNLSSQGQLTFPAPKNPQSPADVLTMWQTASADLSITVPPVLMQRGMDLVWKNTTPPTTAAAPAASAQASATSSAAAVANVATPPSAQLMNLLIQQGWLEKQGDLVKTQIAYHDQKWTVNNKDIQNLIQTIQTFKPGETQQGTMPQSTTNTAQAYIAPAVGAVVPEHVS